MRNAGKIYKNKTGQEHTCINKVNEYIKKNEIQFNLEANKTNTSLKYIMAKAEIKYLKECYSEVKEVFVFSILETKK